MRVKVRIASRQSDLARLQSYRVADALSARLQLQSSFSFRASLGDFNQQDPLWQMPEKGVFTEDFLNDLKTRSADLVVHSWKDLPTAERIGTVVAATLPRADVRDVLLFRRDRLESAKKNARVRVLTSSPRRAHNLADFLAVALPFSAEISFHSVRGNIPTRLRKMLEQDVEGLIVAKAALDRLLEAPEPEFLPVQNAIRSALEQTKWMILPLTINPTAAAQGALAIEMAENPDGAAQDLLHRVESISCQDTFATVQREREILASYGGGCHQKIGVTVLRRSYGEITFLRGVTDDGRVLDRIELKHPPSIRPPRAVNASAMFPGPGEESGFFSREALPREVWSWAEAEPFLLVARESAWPGEFSPREDAVVWTAGLRTWAHLAKRGVWVSGSFEGLGEDEPTRMETMLGKPQISWVKLTHESSAALAQDAQRICGTYRLKPRADGPGREDLAGRQHFFWQSGSAFDRAIQLAPEIVRKGTTHSCGPGLTFRHIKARLQGDLGDRDHDSIFVFLGLEAWREHLGC